jgi:hypothetical protein
MNRTCIISANSCIFFEFITCCIYIHIYVYCSPEKTGLSWKQCWVGGYLRITRGASVWLYTKLQLSCSAFAAKLCLHRWGTVRMIGKEVVVRDDLELAGGDSAWVCCISRWSQFEFAGGMMTLWVECCSNALAKPKNDCWRMAKAGCIQQQFSQSSSIQA